MLLSHRPTHLLTLLHLHTRSYISELFPEGTSEDQMEQLLDQLPNTVLDELKVHSALHA